MNNPIFISHALISVSDKSGVTFFCNHLQNQGISLYSTGGTQALLNEQNICSTSISDYTSFPEILDGRVKTLHPKIFGGLLHRGMSDHQTLTEHQITTFELVVVNLYPFEDTIAKLHSFANAIENIDIGGVSLIRAAAKNFHHVAIVTDPKDYSKIADELSQNQNKLSYETRFELAQKAFKLITQYDAAIAHYFLSTSPRTSLTDKTVISFADNILLSSQINSVLENNKTSASTNANELSQSENNALLHSTNIISEHKNTLNVHDSQIMLKNNSDSLPAYFSTHLVKVQELRYGENPHQKAAFYGQEIELLQGKVLSYNNLVDSQTAYECLGLFTERPSCVIVKHANPCGIASADTLALAYQLAFKTDPVSAFGGIIALNGTVDETLAELIISNQFLEVLIAKDFHPKALEIFKSKPNVRLLTLAQFQNNWPFEFRSLANGILVQQRDERITETSQWQTVSQRCPTDEELEGLKLAWQAVRILKSNAIVFAKQGEIIAFGGGQTSRVDAVRLAALKAEDRGHSLENSVMASDAFFPFKDSIDLAYSLGIRAIIQPGGSIRDPEVIETCNQFDISLIFTGIRHFKH